MYLASGTDVRERWTHISGIRGLCLGKRDIPVYNKLFSVESHFEKKIFFGAVQALNADFAHIN